MQEFTWEVLTCENKLADVQEAEDTQSWITWTQVFALSDGFAHAIYSLIYADKIHISKEGLKKGFLASLKGLHVALQSVDQAFIDAIKAIENGEEPKVEIDPAPIPDWDDDASATLSLLKAGWEMLRPAIIMLIQKLQKKVTPRIEKVIIALEALANASDEIIDAVDKIIST